MATELPYMPSVTNIPSIFEKIRSAATPPRFTHEFLKSNLGFKASNDRSVIKVLKQLGFLAEDGTPKERYNQYRGHAPGAALAAGLRAGWAPLFLSDERVYERSGSELLGIVTNATGSGDAVAQKIASTFKALADKADWTTPSGAAAEPADDGAPVEHTSPVAESTSDVVVSGAFRLHHDIHLHLPPTSDVGVYRAIFKAMKSELM
jgi:hypothetical protein